MKTPEEVEPIQGLTGAVSAPAPRAAEAARVTTDLPAFLEKDEFGEYRLPEGYQLVYFPNGKEQEVALGEREGSTVVCYIQNLGIRLTRGPGGITYFQFLGIPLPESIAPTQRGIPLSESSTGLGSLYLEGGPFGGPRRFERSDWRYLVILPHQTIIRYSGTDFTAPDFGSLGISFHTVATGGRRGDIWIKNENIKYGSIDRIAIPSTAVVKGDGVVPVAAREGREGLTDDERFFVEYLKEITRLEDGVEVGDGGRLQKIFQDTQYWFSKLPVGNRMIVEVMKNVMGQLGAEGEKMRKARKSDEEIFEEWLKRVFIPLYRWAAKK